MRERRIGYGRLGTATHVEGVYASQMRERRIGYGRLGTATHVERVYASQMRERRIGYGPFGTGTHYLCTDGIRESYGMMKFSEFC
jgi:hypothetical protein